jgi:hypothetical protein
MCRSTLLAESMKAHVLTTRTSAAAASLVSRPQAALHHLGIDGFGTTGDQPIFSREPGFA